ncbi:hypothetical protein G9A89_017809 [Geosiphon pyriformis]|nr:hypothetical protein G9A89_017809 [Geosiphon pyriformis]
MSMSTNTFSNPERVWATLLTKENKYVKGAQVLAYSLLKVKSKYPLVILHTDALSQTTLNEFRKLGCLTREIKFINPPPSTKKELNEYYRETWTKLRVWEMEEYQRIVLLDADMLVIQNMDELIELPLKNDWLAASSACTCNPLKVSNYPKDWTPDSCAYTDSKTHEGLHQYYFNAGLLVLTPSIEKFRQMEEALRNHPAPQTLLFPDQDFLNEIFRARWHRLSYKYNALKTLRNCHEKMWNDDEVKNVHYILKKPWDIKIDEESAKQDPAYELYKWWWTVCTEMNSKYPPTTNKLGIKLGMA